MITITVQYSCMLCGILDADVRVPARALHTDVAAWMTQTIGYVSDHHRTRSPDCQAKSLQALKIPISDSEWIGGPVLS